MSGTHLARLMDQLIRASRWPRERCTQHIIPESGPEYSTDYSISTPVKIALENLGIAQLYSHQAEALRALATENVLLSTPTASGKSLCFQIPTLEYIAKDPESTMLYLFPFKALARDQVASLQGFAEQMLRGGFRPLSAVYDGDTSAHKRRAIRKLPPSVFVTNPDIIHYGILPYHTKWSRLLEHVKLIVVDEIHTYRGAFGSHILQVFRRLKRILAHYGSRPRWIACSATIGNPGELAGNLTGEQFHIIDHSGAPVRAKAFLSHFPENKASTASVRMFEACIAAGLKTIVFTKSRRQTELIYRYLLHRNPAAARRVAVYRAGFLPSERRNIEQKLFADELAGVISTSALELGINIGGLDCCILVGFPGSVASLWQRAGRVGRGMNPSLVIYVVGTDALDRYWYEHSEQLYSTPVERVVVYRTNNVITDQHLECAAAELPLQPGVNFDSDEYNLSRIRILTQRGALLESEHGDMFLSRAAHPQRNISLRATGDRYKIFHEDGTVLGEIDGIRVFRECHEGAVYLHGGAIFQVKKLDRENYRIQVGPGPEEIYTQALSEKETEILSTDGYKDIPNARIYWGTLKVTEQVVGYKIKRIFSGETVSTHALTSPKMVFETRGLWILFHPSVMDGVKAAGLHPMGGIHAFEHAVIGLYPIISLCDRNDLAGISTCAHPQTEAATVFLYDSVPGGLGLAESALEKFPELMETTFRHVGQCTCESGCPLCIHSPKCGSGNEPLDKKALLFILNALVSPGTLFPAFENNLSLKKELKMKKDTSENTFKIPALPPETECPAGTGLVFDIETQLSADEVGGWNHSDRMKVAIAVVYDMDLDRYEFYREADVPRLLKRLQAAKLVIGFNSDNFDFKVLSGYVSGPFPKINSLDLLKTIRKTLGHRLSLNQIAAATLDAEKSADGLQSLRWWKQGRLDLIAAYCRKDVEITFRVYDYGRRNGYVLYRHRSGMKVKAPVDWK